MDSGPEFISEALRYFCAGTVGISYIPPGTPWNNGFIESFNNRLRDECLNRNCWPTLLEARVPGAHADTTPSRARSTDQRQVRTGSRTTWAGYRGPASSVWGRSFPSAAGRHSRRSCDMHGSGQTSYNSGTCGTHRQLPPSWDLLVSYDCRT
ncbi:integrase core domain-containing protein [Gordonia liuliyuniae]|uniref:integrase core domain-containing protein n=1 Tax=Gordonia liuliyuniae TaxID=2911517 RepID=UPI003557EAC5